VPDQAARGTERCQVAVARQHQQLKVAVPTDLGDRLQAEHRRAGRRGDIDQVGPPVADHQGLGGLGQANTPVSARMPPASNEPTKWLSPAIAIRTTSGCPSGSGT
jgi:hypothetical protein